MASIGKRKAERRACDMRGQIQFRNGREPVDCTIVDTSSTGARLKFKEEVDLPGRFALYIPSRSDTKICLFRWRSDLEIGIEFSTADTQADEELIDLNERLEVVERQVAALVAGDDVQPAPAVRPAAAPAPQEARLVEPVRAEAPPHAETHGLPPASFQEISARIDEVESLGAEADAAIEKKFGARISIIEARLSSEAADPYGAAREQIDAAISDLHSRMAALETRADEAADDEPAPRDESLVARLADIERRLAQSSAAAASTPAAPTPPRGPDALAAELAGRMAEFESRLKNIADRPAFAAEPMARETASDNARLEPRLATLERDLFDLGERLAQEAAAPNKVDAEIESLLARIETLEDERQSVPQGGAGPDALELERKIERLEFRLDDLADSHLVDPHPAASLAPAPLAPAVDSGLVEGLVERMSNMEVDMLNLKFGKPSSHNPEYEARLARLEEQNRDIHAALKEVLALLARRTQEQRDAG